MHTGAVSVVIPHYGDPAPTRALCAALAAQEGATSLQVVVVDDASPEPFPHVDEVAVVRRDTNGGFGSAVNTGAALVEHDLLLVLNSDLEVGADFVESLLENAEPWWPAVVSPRVVDRDGSPLWTGRRYPTASQQAVEWLTPLVRLRDRRVLHEAVGHVTSAQDGATVVDWVVGAAMLMPTVDFRAVGGFDERFFMNAEEVDLQRRLRDRGIPSVVLARPVVVHEGGGSSDHDRRRRWLVASRLAYADKWGGRRRLQASLTAATAVNLAWNAGRRLAGRDVQPIRTARHELDLIFDRLGP
jgi:N-acetylglucosaminyl-diphospho-decaprenol L-rhamnosyltransferase